MVNTTGKDVVVVGVVGLDRGVVDGGCAPVVIAGSLASKD